MSLVEEINAAYAELKETRRLIHALEGTVDAAKQAVIELHFEELKTARSVEVRNQTINVFLKDEEEYWRAVDDLSETHLRFDIAKDEIDRLKLLARIEVL